MTLEAPTPRELQVVKVSELNQYIKLVLEQDEALADVWVEGEVSNCALSRNGHLFFTLKDERCQMQCVCWANLMQRTRLQPPKNGDQIIVHARMRFYEPQGTCQLQVDLIQPRGTGILRLRFEQLRNRLDAEGLFEPSRKRRLPAYPKCIGIVTSPAAAALRDILNVLGRRYPLARVVIAETSVQGDDAVPGVCAGINALNDRGDVDVMIVARGGGSLEDLWAFNEEAVARAIYASRVPVVTGIGHETDYTIADYVADLRAPTPSAAAELVAPDLDAVYRRIVTCQSQLVQSMLSRLGHGRDEVYQTSIRLKNQSPKAKMAANRTRLDYLTRRVCAQIETQITVAHERLRGLEAHLGALSPLAVLERGYAICWNEDRTSAIRSVSQVSKSQHLIVQVNDGTFGVQA